MSRSPVICVLVVFISAWVWNEPTAAYTTSSSTPWYPWYRQTTSPWYSWYRQTTSSWYPWYRQTTSPWYSWYRQTTSSWYPWYRRTTPSWWWTSTPRLTDLARAIQVSCDAYSYNVYVDRYTLSQVYPYLSPYDMSLADRRCRGQVSSGRVSFHSSILGCGMHRTENSNEIIYRNRIKLGLGGTTNSYYTTDSIITRQESLGISTECVLSRDVSVVGSFKPTNHNGFTVKGYGNFSMQMNFYQDSAYRYRIYNYPVRIGLNENLYVEIKLVSSDNSLKIVVQECHAMPTRDPLQARRQGEVYTLIRYGCPSDRTLSYDYSSMDRFRFQFRSFEFRNSIREIYIFCTVTVCERNDNNSRCHNGCRKNIVKRELRAETSDSIKLFQGPLLYRADRSVDEDKAETTSRLSNASAAPAIMVVAAVVMMVSAAVMFAVKMKKRQIRRPTVEEENLL